jgi:hypothetical protein
MMSWSEGEGAVGLLSGLRFNRTNHSESRQLFNPEAAALAGFVTDSTAYAID